MRLRPRPAALILGVLGCLRLPSDDAAYRQALDYHLDRPRLLGLAITPTALTEGVEASFEALILGPPGVEAGQVRWRSCGLELDSAVNIWDLSCFSDDLEVVDLGAGNPMSWTPPTPPGCEDTGYCYSSFPFLMEAEIGGEELRGAFFASVSPADQVIASAISWRTLPLTITASEQTDGQITLEAWMGLEAQQQTFRWYVDDGTLLDTARTAIQGERDGGVYSTNRWVVPEENGSFRVVVVVSSYEGFDGWDTGGTWEARTAHDTAGWYSWSEVPNMTWAQISVEVP